MLRKERENFSTFTTKTSAIERLLYKFKVPIQDIIADPQEIDSVIMAHDLWVKEGNPVLFHELNKTKYLEIMRIAF
jgi:hypothetical protein